MEYIAEEVAYELSADWWEALGSKIMRALGSRKIGSRCKSTWVGDKCGAIEDREAASVAGTQQVKSGVIKFWALRSLQESMA